MKIRSFIAISVFFEMALSVAAVRGSEVSGVSIPEVVSVAGEQLRLNGMALVKKVFFKVYVVGLYLEKQTTDARAAITTDEAKRIVIVMLRDVSREEFVPTVEQGIMRNSGPAMATLLERLDLLQECCPPSRKAMFSISRTCRAPAPWSASRAGR
jgi:hypothetical protein